MVRDNKTSQPAGEYDANIEKNLPMHGIFTEHAIDIVREVKPDPARWLDTGCGTGILAVKSALDFANTEFVLADPSEAMLNLAKQKLAAGNGLKAEYRLGGTEDLEFPAESFDVITAVLAHHYFPHETRIKATENCYRWLKTGGVYVTVETVKPETKKALDIGLKRWQREQLRLGKSKESSDKYISRYGKELLPVTIQEQLTLLRDTGFSVVEIFWATFLQVGYYAIK